MAMSSAQETARLRALIERPRVAYLWGQPYTITPRLIAERFGDGQKLVIIEPIMTRPNYFVARVDSATKSMDDPWPESLWGRTDARLLDVIMDAQVDEYGDYADIDDDGYPWPIVNWDEGCSWSDPFPITEWKTVPRVPTGSRLTRARWRRKDRR